jgi:hypothetical protein
MVLFEDIAGIAGICAVLGIGIYMNMKLRGHAGRILGYDRSQLVSSD